MCTVHPAMFRLKARRIVNGECAFLSVLNSDFPFVIFQFSFTSSPIVPESARRSQPNNDKMGNDNWKMENDYLAADAH